MKIILCLFAVFFCTFQLSALTVKLPSAPEKWEINAAEKLKKFISESVGENIFINDKSPEFHVGETDFVKSLKLQLQDEEWIVKSFGSKIVLCGGGTRGTQYAVAKFLEQYLGILIFNTCEKYIPKHKELKLDTIDLKGKPHFQMRLIYCDWSQKRDGGDFAVFNRLNGYGDGWINAENGGSFSFGSPYAVHTFNMYISQKEFFKDHPEYFSLGQNGKRNPHRIRGQLCLSNPDVLEIMWDKLQKFILADEKKAAQSGLPAPMLYEISQNDNNSYCHCQNCVKLRKHYGNAEAGLQLHLINQLAKRLKKFRPALKISTLAYFQTEKIPANIIPESNVVIRLCNTSCNFADSPLGEGGEYLRDRLKKWSSISETLGIWDYGISFNAFARGLPYPSEFFMRGTAQFYRRNKIKYIFCEREYIYNADMHSLKTWLNAKFMEDPDADFDKLLKTFCNAYYGKAAPFIIKYRTELYNSVKKNRPYITAFEPAAISFSHLDCKTVTICDKLLAAAEKAVADDPLYLRRVREARASIDEAILIGIRKFNLENPQNELDYSAAVKRLDETLKNSIRFYIRPERHKYCMTRIARLDSYKNLPKTVKKQTIAPNGIDIPIELANWWAGFEPLVLDKESESGYAVRIKQNGMPILIGGFDKQTRTENFNTRLNFADIKGRGYHWYEIKKPFTPVYAGYIYLTNKWFVQFPQGIAKIKSPDAKWKIFVSLKVEGKSFPFGKKDEKNAIYIDRIVIVPVK